MAAITPVNRMTSLTINPYMPLTHARTQHLSVIFRYSFSLFVFDHVRL